MKQREKEKMLRTLKQAYEAPAPVGKQEFLERLEERKREVYATGEYGTRETYATGEYGARKTYATGEYGAWETRRAQAFGERDGRISMFRMMAVQLTYLPKWVWGISAAIFFLAFWGSRYLPEEARWNICACVPFLGMASVEGSFRSLLWKMEELEMASRFSLQSILAARMAVLGFGNLLFLLFLAGCTGMLKGGQVLFFLVPYLLSSLGCLHAARRWKGKEGIYAGMGVAACVSLLALVLYGNFAWLLGARYLGWWLFMAGVLGILFLRESVQMIKKTEELLWN